MRNRMPIAALLMAALALAVAVGLGLRWTGVGGGSAQSRLRVLRGGSWLSGGEAARSAYRRGAPRDARGINFGFRVVVEVP